VITLITGLNGSGKTLHLVSEFRKRYEGRQFYYHRFKNVSLPWIELKSPDEWINCPPTSVIVFDEAQEYWPKREGKTPSPLTVDKLPVHRADFGLDIIIITPDPALIDIDVRRLVTEHIHLERKFNAEFSHMWTFPRCIMDPYDNDDAKSKAVGGVFNFPKENYGLYISAPAHTMKRRIPWKLWAFIPAVALVGFCAYTAYDILIGSKHSALNGGKVPESVAAPLHSPGQSHSGTISAPKTPAEYIEQRTPLIDGLQFTAPAYSGVTAPTRAPYPAACVASTRKCTCYTQDATVLLMGEGLCRDIAAKGIFIDWSSQQAQQQQPAPSGGLPASPSPIVEVTDQST
jgi:zona occludens toxin